MTKSARKLKTREHLIESVDTQIAECQQKIDTFSAEILMRPHSTLEWSAGVFEAAAALNALRLIRDLALSGSSFEKITGTLSRRSLEGARYPSRSTSVPSNLMEQELTAAYARFFDKLTFISEYDFPEEKKS